MAFTYGFYDSMNHDRRYTAEQVSSLFDGLITDGVFDTIGNMLFTAPGEGLQVVVKPGKAWFNHTWSINDSDYILDLEPADVTRDRIDAVVLEINQEEDIRANSLKVIKGSASTTPTKPSLINNEKVHQYALSYVTVPGAATSIEEKNINIVVGMAPTPFVTGLVEHIDITDLFKQWNGQFDEWFEHVQTSLSGDIAGNLQYQIDHKVNVSDKATPEEVAEKLSDTKWITPLGLDSVIQPILDSIEMCNDHSLKISTASYTGNQTSGVTTKPDPRVIDIKMTYFEWQPAFMIIYGKSYFCSYSGSSAKYSDLVWVYIRSACSFYIVPREYLSSTASVTSLYTTAAVSYSTPSPTLEQNMLNHIQITLPVLAISSKYYGVMNQSGESYYCVMVGHD